MVTGEENRVLILFLTGTFTFCLIAVGFILFYFRSVNKIHRKQLQIEKDRFEHQQELLKNVMQTEEKERRRFSRDLHDEAGALLASIKLKMNLIRQEANNPEQVRQLSVETRDLLSDTIQSVRNISHNLLPPSLETFGLFRCLEGFFRELQVSMETDFRYKTDRKRLPPEIELAMYRVTTELCNNTIKHAKADKITMRIHAEENRLTAVYRDNGSGTNQVPRPLAAGPQPPALAGKDRPALTSSQKKPVIVSGLGPAVPGRFGEAGTSGLGLSNLESRITVLNGTIEFCPAAGRGMEVRIKVPLS